jgi:hypothetical protein
LLHASAALTICTPTRRRQANWISGRKGKHHKPTYKPPEPFRYRALTYVQLSHQSQSLEFTAIWKSRLQVAKMSTIPAYKIEHNRDISDGRSHVCALPANQPYDGEEACCFALGGGT